MDEKGFNLSAFISEWKETLLNPKGYFATMKTQGGLGEPIIKALIYGTVAGIIYFIWSLLHFGSYGVGYFGAMGSVGVLFMSIIGSVIGVFIGGVIVLIISSISNGNKDFEACLRVAAALMALYPVSALLSVVGGIHLSLVTIVSLAVNLYGLYMLFLAITEALKGDEKTVKIVAYVLGGLLILFVIIGLIASLFVRAFSGYGQNKAEEMMESYQKMAEKAAINFQAAAEAMAQSQAAANYIKPESFPSEAIKQLESFPSGEMHLTRETIQNLIAATKAIQNLSDEEKESVIKENGFESREEYAKGFVSVFSGMAALNGLAAMEQIINAANAEQEGVENFNFDQAVVSIVNQSIFSSGISEQDLRTIYENWDLAIELKNATNQ